MAALIISCALSAMLLINKKIGHRGVCHRSTNSIMMHKLRLIIIVYASRIRDPSIPDLMDLREDV